MKFRVVCSVFLCLTLVGVGFGAGPEYQTGKVIKVEKQERSAPSGGSDAPKKGDVSSYHVSIQLGDKIYLCSFDTHSEHDPPWAEGKDVQARVSGKVIYVKKASGEVKGPILSTSSAGNQ